MDYKCFVTDYEKQEFWRETKEVSDDVNCMNVVNIYPDITYQTVEGFGGAFTEASGYNLSLLGTENQDEVIKAYFGRDGLDYSLCRTHINSCDFALGNYAYVVDEKDTEFNTFTIERDRQYIIPMIQKAQQVKGDKLAMLASPWSPPAFMKTNGEMNHGGKLKKEYYGQWARYIARYIKSYREEGIDISMLSVQNEPAATQTWDSCEYTAEEERDFVKGYLGPVLEEEGLGDVKILVWDHNKEILYERAKTVLDDQDAARYVKGVGFHWYTGDHFDAVALVREKYPDTGLYFTEGCVEYSRFMDSNEVTKAEMYAHDIIGNFNAGMNGYMDWNLLLDDKGGPNHVKNYCAAPIMCSPSEDTVEKRLCYYYIGHFSRYIKPGAKRAAVTRYTDLIDAAGFINPDGERVLVILNKSDKEVPVSVREYGDGKSYLIGSHTIATILYKQP